jgi:hypothetical protein
MSVPYIRGGTMSGLSGFNMKPGDRVMVGLELHLLPVDVRRLTGVIVENSYDNNDLVAVKLDYAPPVIADDPLRSTYLKKTDGQIVSAFHKCYLMPYIVQDVI